MFIVIVGLAACSSGGELTVAKPKSEAIRPNATVALSVNALEGSGSPEHVQDGVLQIRTDLYANLPAAGVFTQVVPEGQPADYDMQIGINNVRLVSGTARFWGGAFAGSNVVTGDVKLIDQSNGLEVTSFTATGTSASHPVSSESGFDDAVREFTGQVTQALQ
ncbi:MAG: DUF4410 domain-containing protein [Geminicoccaceae bacterium]